MAATASVQPPSRIGAFIAPHHDPRLDATLQIRRDV